MAATIKDIASKTGLGLATISKYLNGGVVLKKNRIAIEQAIKELDFSVNELARSLKTKRSMTIGVVIPEFTSTFIANIIKHLEDILRQKGYSVIVCDCRSNPELEAGAIEFLLNKRVDGIINMPTSDNAGYLANAVAKRVPVVIIDRFIKDCPVNAVLIDNVAIAKEAVEHFITHNHTKIGIIVGPPNIFTAQQRLLGYNQALINNSITPNSKLIYHGDYNIEGGYFGTKELLKCNPDMTALLSTNYEMTIGSFIALNELGVKVPSHLSFIGFDNMDLSKVTNPRVTIIEQPLENIGRNAADLMLRALLDANAPPHTVTLTAKILHGDTVIRNVTHYT